MNPTSYRINQELKAFRKAKKKTYSVQSSTKLFTPWIRTIHPKFDLGQLGIKMGDKLTVSFSFGTDMLTRNSVLSTDTMSIYNHEMVFGNFAICNTGLLDEFESIPEVLYFTITRNRNYTPPENCNC